MECKKSKEQALLKLAKKRQQTRYDGFTCIGDYDEGIWECDYISPYSLTAHNPNAEVMVVLQDWCSSESFELPVCEKTLKLGYTPSVRTNITLAQHLKTYFNITLEDTYATNLFPFVKPGPMNAPIATKAMKQAATDFTIPLIKIVKPKLVICLGIAAFNGLRRASGLKNTKNMQQAITSPFKIGNSIIFAQAHTGQLGQNNRNRAGVQRVANDWQTMKKIFTKTKD